MSAIFAAIYLFVPGVPSWALWLIVLGGVMFLVLGGLEGLLERVGNSRGVLRLSREGIGSGAGERRGNIRRWPPRGVRVEIVRRTAELVRLRGSVMWGPFRLWDVFDVYAPLGAEQQRGLLERLRAWGPEGMVIRERVMRRLGKRGLREQGEPRSEEKTEDKRAINEQQ
jgi:hypothetical protein